MEHHDNTEVTGRGRTGGTTHFPQTVADVVALVRAARSSGKPIYPLSTGLNWGYGSRSPTLDGCELLDLSRMNSILNAEKISNANPLALLQPGVTQGQLYSHLRAHAPALTFNVTGSGCDTSILGNALDGGVGYWRPRRDDVFGLEIVTGTGEVIQTGFRRLGEGSPLAGCHPHGMGPMLDGLFFQGNCGIVTSAYFRLAVRPPAEAAVSLTLLNDANLADFLNILAGLKRDGILHSVTHVGNRARTHSTLLPGVARYLESRCGLDPAQARSAAQTALNRHMGNEWTGLCAIAGSARQVRASLGIIRQRLRGRASVRVVTQARLDAALQLTDRLARFSRYAAGAAAIVSAVRPLHGLALGVPTDAPISGLLWQAGRPDAKAAELDASRCGMLYISPALPMDGAFVTHFMQKMKLIAASFGHTLYTTINFEAEFSIVAVINLLFDRQDPEAMAQAHRCADALLDCVHDCGLEVYRARVDMMQAIVSDTPYWRLQRSIKRVFDPDNIIAPQRYSLP